LPWRIISPTVYEVEEAETRLERLDRVVHVARDLLLLEQRAFLLA
jgi:hypothetical protein